MRIITDIFNAIYNNLISGGAYYLIAKGVLVTAVVTVTAWVVATAFGSLVSYLMCYEKKFVSAVGRGICFVFRSIPVLLIMWLFYYCVFGTGRIPSMLTAGVAIGFWGAGHMAELIAHSVAVRRDKLSSSLSDKLEKVFYSTVLPQALEDSLFDIKRLFIHILQWSAVAGYINVNDLTEVMYGIGHRTMYPFFSIFFTAICYMLATIIIEAVFNLLEKKADSKT